VLEAFFKRALAREREVEKSTRKEYTPYPFLRKEMACISTKVDKS